MELSDQHQAEVEDLAAEPSAISTKKTSNFFRFVKGQIISKWFFGDFDFQQKTNENKSIWGIIVVKSNSFVRFLEEIEDIKNPFEIIWPLARNKFLFGIRKQFLILIKMNWV